MPSADRDPIVNTLRSRGLRATGPRMGVYRAAAELPGHPDVGAIAERVAERDGPISTQAVYDSLHALAAAGLLRRIEPAGSPAKYESRVGDNHHHVVCRVCGTVQDVDCVTGAAPCLDPDDVNGYMVDEAEITFWGLCPRCQPKAETHQSRGRG